jgi:hypothetical protein
MKYGKYLDSLVSSSRRILLNGAGDWLMELERKRVTK